MCVKEQEGGVGGFQLLKIQLFSPGETKLILASLTCISFLSPSDKDC